MPGKYKKAARGQFIPKNPQKYRGDVTDIWYRSGMEKTLYTYIDERPEFIWWASEELIINYFNPAKKRMSRYFPDALVCWRDKNSVDRVMLIEVKSKSETHPPTKKGRVTRRYVESVITWKVNEAKWKAAQNMCQEKGWQFKVLTEENLGRLAH